MAQIDQNLATRETQLKEALDLLTKKHGAQSETVALIQTRLTVVQNEITEYVADVSDEKEDTAATQSDARFVRTKLPQAKDAARMFVLIGGILIFALGGLSTMFVLMIALGFGK